MKLLAWAVLWLYIGSHILVVKQVVEKETRVYEPSDVVASIIGICLYLPICGRVLGWW